MIVTRIPGMTNVKRVSRKLNNPPRSILEQYKSWIHPTKWMWKRTTKPKKVLPPRGHLCALVPRTPSRWTSALKRGGIVTLNDDLTAVSHGGGIDRASLGAQAGTPARDPVLVEPN